MELTRSKIRKYLDDEFGKTSYCKKVNGTMRFDILKTMSVADLDFIEVIDNFYLNLKESYSLFPTLPDWTKSDRQKFLVMNLNDMCDDLVSEDIKKVNVRYLQTYVDIFWNIYDYFDDYGNKNETIYKEEVEGIFPIFEKFINIKLGKLS